MAFTRKFLADNGVPEENIDAVMAERGRSLEGYILKSDVTENYVAKTEIKKQIDDAVKKASENPPKVEDTDEYKALQDKLTKLETLQTEEFKGLKSKFRDDAWAKLDHTKPYADQMKEFKEKYPEYWEESKPTSPTPPRTPVFSQDNEHQNQNLTPEQKAAAEFIEGFGDTRLLNKKE